MRSRPLTVLSLAGAFAALAPGLWAQGARFDAAYGPWFPRGDSVAQVFHAGIIQQVGLIGLGLSLVHVADDGSVAGRTLTGGEVTLRLGHSDRGLYALAGTGLGFRHANGNVDAFWTAGAGYALHLFSSFALGLEGRYRWEDTEVTGFWRRAAGDRDGIQAQLRLTFGVPHGGSAGDARPVGERPPADAGRPSPPDPYATALARGASEEAARVTASVVETALEVMGSPYEWGGTDGNGFDCSGLVQYAYGQHGIVLPRVSRDQMRMGKSVGTATTVLRPGDVLGFSADHSSRITHVGLYVGNGEFIHSSSSGVKLSSLEATDGDGPWWRERWVSTRRIIE
jgi:cell wall-associated NlpC family hydrolase